MSSSEGSDDESDNEQTQDGALVHGVVHWGAALSLLVGAFTSWDLTGKQVESRGHRFRNK